MTPSIDGAGLGGEGPWSRHALLPAGLMDVPGPGPGYLAESRQARKHRRSRESASRTEVPRLHGSIVEVAGRSQPQKDQ